MTNSPNINFILKGKIINFLLQNNFRFSTPTMAGHSPEPPPQSKKSHFQFSFFFQTAVRHPAVAARLTESGDNAPRAKAHSIPGGSGKRDGGGKARGRRWRDFRSRLHCRRFVGRVRGDGWMTAGVKPMKIGN
jgi:hypothetical protein